MMRILTTPSHLARATISPGAGNAEACRQIIDQWKQNGARGGEAVALGAALAGATAELGGAAWIGEESAQRGAQRDRVLRRDQHAASLENLGNHRHGGGDDRP